MKQGFIKVAALTPKVKVADPQYNKQVIIEEIKKAASKNAKIIVFPELCITGYSCSDLFLQQILLEESVQALLEIAKFTEVVDALVFVGLPVAVDGNLYNVAAVLSKGTVMALVPKTNIPTYNEFYEGRYFASAPKNVVPARLTQELVVPMGTDILFQCAKMPEVKIAAELCEDLWVPNPPSIRHAMAGANIIVNLSASNEITGKDGYRLDLVKGQSGRLICGYVYASAGEGESTQDVVYSGHNIIAENGRILAESKRFANEPVYSEFDVQLLNENRRRMNTFAVCHEGYMGIPFQLDVCETTLSRFIDPAPFVPSKEELRTKRCEEILNIQSYGLKKRIEHTNAKTAVIGISGGLDSTLAFLVTVKAFDLLGKDHKDIIAVTMPGFGTTDRTYDNACTLIRRFGATLQEINIKNAVRVHFDDIGHDESIHDVTYENAQARQRTLLLMDIANQKGGMVIGTGDLSELALGWATYNGDHMSMYGVNASVPKTLVRHLVSYYAEMLDDKELQTVLLDVLDTPVSPELLPPEDGKISQKTEDLVGPYELHDFFLYQMLRCGYSPKKIFRLARIAFDGQYEKEEIAKWLQTFIRRFFAQQFKRSCLPDGPKVGSVAVSPRGDLRMPSDASYNIWRNEAEHLLEEEKEESVLDFFDKNWTQFFN
ncbi:NAD(+) synthase [Eubacterium oxidoreducens]|uniref:Glutamine-dependent NAD(+) synthetase n=1 Tax=Eubacterium oxidoreducens TaxID=1732 RepID=A0A1G6BKU0_EUBOX|nr:NAD(+) synthase [Eubacterium oxidoreducens]SDB21208.1 NAD+ synthase (glutamine-hydrolysing) [Eubacterium oxidoreducens]